MKSKLIAVISAGHGPLTTEMTIKFTALGAMLSASLATSAQPVIPPTTALQHQAVFVGQRASFTVTASGTAPLAYQWRLDGHDLAGQTNRTLTLSGVQPTDEGDYTVVVTNVAGAATSYSSRLWVVPPISSWVIANFTNSLGRLPYAYFVPANYTAARTWYPAEPTSSA